MKDAAPAYVVKSEPALRPAPEKPKTPAAPAKTVAQPAAPKVVAKPAAPTQPVSKLAPPAATIADCKESADCTARLKAMIADPDQKWMGNAPTAIEFSTGTRLFAYRALRPRLDCKKLAQALKEIGWALDTFSKPVPGLKDGIVALVREESRKVQQEISAEIKSRC